MRLKKLFMKRNIYFLLLFFPLHALTQNVVFNKSNDTVYLSGTKDSTVYTARIKCEGCGATPPAFTISADASGDLPATEFTTQSGAPAFTPRQSVVAYYVNFKPTNENNYGKSVTLRLTHDTDTSFMHIYVLRPEHPDSSRYRFMIGTNFDFVDGIRAKDLYYHLQFFLPDGFSKRFGFVGGIQQNRQVSGLDTALTFNNAKRGVFADSFRLNRFEYLPNDSFRIVRVDSTTLTKTNSTTVLQLYFEPTYKIYKNNGPRSKSDLYTFLHFDLQYKTFTEEQTYNYKIRDTIGVNRSSFSKYAAVKEKDKIKQSIYQFNYGAGLLVHHENKYVDMYVKMMIGAVHLAENTWSGYYGNELGIRVVPFNIMLGGEYRGLFKQHDPIYLNIYLSKVFSLSKLAEIISK